MPMWPLPRFAAALPLLALATLPAAGQETVPAATPAPMAAVPTPGVPAAVVASAPARMPAVRVRAARQADHGRVVFHFGRIPDFDLRKTSEGMELRLRGGYGLDLAGLRPLTELASVTARREGADTVILLRLNCDCSAESVSGNGMLWINLRPAVPPASAAATSPSAASPPAAPTSVAPARPANGRDAKRTTAEAARRRLLDDAVRLNLMTRAQADAMLHGAAAPAPATADRPAEPDEATRLRQSLLAQLGTLNRPQPAAPSQAKPPGQPPGQLAAPLPRPSCAAPFDMAGWAGETTGPAFPDRLVALRQALATSAEAPEDVATLAEFLVSQGLFPEALELLDGRITETMTETMQLRMQRLRDVARLLRRLPIDTGSPLLADSATCEREDLGLWQALAAAVAGDTAAVVRLAPRARVALRGTPERLRFAFTFALADAVGDDLEALKTLVGPIRSAAAVTEAESAGRSWLLARIAGLEGSSEEERLNLTRAARGTHTVPGLFASARLAAAQAALGPGVASDPEMQRAEARLLDFARTYRFDSLGEEAAMLFAQLLLGRGDLSGALVAADGASQSGSRPGAESRGANFAARILRLLLVDAESKPLPSAAERLALYWRYEGYATPGERGDDIRLGAARLMLEQGLAEAALDTVRQLAPATAQTGPAVLLIARTEAAAAQGDPQRALALLRALPVTDEVHRIAASALARLGRPADAARELEGMRTIADQTARARYFYTAQNWPEAMTAYAELLREPALDTASRADATSRYVGAAALSPRPAAAVPSELLTLQDAGTTALLQLASEPASATASAQQGMEQVRGAIERAKRIEALLAPAKVR